MTFTPVDFVALQLRESAPLAEWNVAGVDRAQELARMMVRAGIVDISKLQLRAVQVTSTPAAPWLAPTITQALQLVYNGRGIGFLGTPDRQDSDKVLQGLQVAWSAEGSGNVGYNVHPSPLGFVITPSWGSSSDAADVRKAVVFLGTVMVSAVLPAAGISVGNSIGTAVLGPSLSASYPALASAVGNVALSTVMNGGNIANAVRSVALSYVGASAGGAAGSLVADATGLEVLGKVSQAAVSAFVKGGDVQTAVLQSLAVYGASNMDEFFSVDTLDPVESTPVEFNASADYFDPVYDAPASAPESFTMDQVDFEWNYGDMPAPEVSLTTVTGDDAMFPTQGYVPSPAIPPADTSPGLTFTPGDVIKTVTSAAMAALQLTAAYNQVRNPPRVNTTARAVTPNGAVIAANDNGLIQTRDASGRVSSSRPPVGQPQSTLSGSIIINNGDGTYTLIDSMGNTSTRRYASGEAGGGFSFDSVSPGMLAIGAAGIVGVLLLSRRRS